MLFNFVLRKQNFFAFREVRQLNKHCLWEVKLVFYWLYVIIMSRTSFRVNLHSIVCLNAKDVISECHIWRLTDSNEIRSYNHLLRIWTLNHLAKLANGCLNGWVFVYELSGCGVRIPLLSLGFLYVGIWFDKTKCKFIVKNSSLKCWLPIFLADTSIFISQFL